MRLIDADAVKYEPLPKGERNYRTYNLDDAYDDGYDDAMFNINHMPTVDAEPVRHGKWAGAESQCAIGCPFCGTPVDDFCESIDYIYLIYEPNYCPNCGARLKDETD